MVTYGDKTVIGRSHAARARFVALGILLDEILGDPSSSIHPVALFGATMERYEQRFWRDSKLSGALYAVSGSSLALLAAIVTERAVGDAGALVASTCISSASKSLLDTAGELGTLLEAGRLEDAREALRSLVGRDCESLDGNEIARAVVESVAENLSDAVVGSVVWATMLGTRGVLLHRAVNTMDAMVGHKSARYRRFGWASARLDDLMGRPAAYMTVICVICASPSRAGEILKSIRDAPKSHPSHNARICEAAFAAAIGVELGGENRYGDRVENRGPIGCGPRVAPQDITTAVALARRAIGVLVFLLLAIGEVRSRCGGAREAR